MDPIPTPQGNPEDALIFGYDILLRWINPLIEISNKRDIIEDDVWPCPKEEDIQIKSDEFWKLWYAEIDLAEQQNRKPDLKIVVFQLFRTKFITAGILQLCFLCASIGQPFLVGLLVEYVQTGKGGIAYGVGYALIFAGISVCASLTLSVVLDTLRRLGVAVRSCLMLAVYEQAQKLTAAARMKSTVGEFPRYIEYFPLTYPILLGQTTNLMAIDCEKLNWSIIFIHFIW